MKLILLCAALFMAVMLYSQEIKLEGSEITMEYASQTCAVHSTNGDLYLEAFASDSDPGATILIEDEGHVGVHEPSPDTPLHLRQISGNTDGNRGFRIENSAGTHHWTIEINKIDHELNFYFDGNYKASIETDGSFSQIMSPLAGNSKNTHQTNLKQNNTGGSMLSKVNQKINSSKIEKQIIEQTTFII